MSKFLNQPLTIAYIRDQVRRNQYIGDMFEGLQFLLQQYDIVNDRLKAYTRPQEYNVKFKGDVA